MGGKYCNNWLVVSHTNKYHSQKYQHQDLLLVRTRMKVTNDNNLELETQTKNMSPCHWIYLLYSRCPQIPQIYPFYEGNSLSEPPSKVDFSEAQYNHL